MATELVNSYNRYIGNGATTEFSIGFPYINKEYVKVYVKKIGEQEVKLDSTQFEFVNDQTIRYPLSGELLLDGEVLTIQRETPVASDFVFENQHRLFPESVMDADDLAMQILQEHSRQLDRTIMLSPTDTTVPEAVLNMFEEVYGKKEELDIVSQNVDVIKAVSGSIDNVNLVANNIDGIFESAENARIWAEGDRHEVEALGGVHSSRGAAGLSMAYANADEDVPVEDWADSHAIYVQGEKGDPFTYNDFTPEQLEGLRGPQGPEGPRGFKGDPSYASAGVVTILSSSWDASSKLATVSVPAVKENSIVWISPSSASYEAYATSSVRGVAQGSGTLTFFCKTVPTENLNVEVVVA